MNQKIFNGFNSIKKINEIISEENIKKIFIVMSKVAYENSEFEKIIIELNNKEKIKTEYFYEFSPNPTYEDMIKGLEIFEQDRYDCIISFGGGSTIDMAKLMNYFAFENMSFETYLKDKKIKKEKLIKHISIPTTCGTGSEATHFAVLYYNKIKFSIADLKLIPDIIILDSQFLKKLPDYVLASSVMDSLAQGIESYWSVNSTEESKNYSKLCINLVLENYFEAFKTRNEQSLQSLLEASHYSGKAINITKTTAPHAMSYVLTSKYNIAHGHAVMMLLPYIYEYNSNLENSINDNRGLEYLKTVFEELNNLLKVNSSIEAKNKLIGIMKELNLECKINKNTKNIDILKLAESVNEERLNNNPINFIKTDVIKIYKIIAS